MRRRLTLDLFTRYGSFWTAVDEIRSRWRVSPTVAVPPEPNFHVEHVKLTSWRVMPERFHMPDPTFYVVNHERETELRRIATAGGWLEDMEELIREHREAARTAVAALFLNDTCRRSGVPRSRKTGDSGPTSKGG